jgi:hypothetical protein
MIKIGKVYSVTVGVIIPAFFNSSNIALSDYSLGCFKRGSSIDFKTKRDFKSTLKSSWPRVDGSDSSAKTLFICERIFF